MILDEVLAVDEMIQDIDEIQEKHSDSLEIMTTCGTILSSLSTLKLRLQTTKK